VSRKKQPLVNPVIILFTIKLDS